MLLFALICLSLALVGIAGLQFTYLFYLDRVDRERKKLVRDLQSECHRLSARLNDAQQRLAEQERLLSLYSESEEAWADVLDER